MLAGPAETAAFCGGAPPWCLIGPFFHVLYQFSRNLDLRFRMKGMGKWKLRMPGISLANPCPEIFRQNNQRVSLPFLSDPDNSLSPVLRAPVLLPHARQSPNANSKQSLPQTHPDMNPEPSTSLKFSFAQPLVLTVLPAIASLFGAILQLQSVTVLALFASPIMSLVAGFNLGCETGRTAGGRFLFGVLWSVGSLAVSLLLQAGGCSLTNFDIKL